MAKIDSEFSKWVEGALSLGFDCFTEGDPAPLVLLLVGGKRQMIELKKSDGGMDGTLLASGRDLIRQFAADGEYYVLVWDGYLTREDKRCEAVFAEAGAGGGTTGRVFAQCYRRTKTGAAAKVGKSSVVAEVAHLWIESDVRPDTTSDNSPRQ